MRIAKINRIAVYNKFDGHCAYCGSEIEFKNMQVDHLVPQCLQIRNPEIDVNDFKNIMPSCQKCNNHKFNMLLEIWRKELERHSDMLQKNTQFQRAIRFGQVKITKQPVVFYFEKLKK